MHKLASPFVQACILMLSRANTIHPASKHTSAKFNPGLHFFWVQWPRWKENKHTNGFTLLERCIWIPPSIFVSLPFVSFFLPSRHLHKSPPRVPRIHHSQHLNTSSHPNSHSLEPERMLMVSGWMTLHLEVKSLQRESKDLTKLSQGANSALSSVQKTKIGEANKHFK